MLYFVIHNPNRQITKNVSLPAYRSLQIGIFAVGSHNKPYSTVSFFSYSRHGLHDTLRRYILRFIPYGIVHHTGVTDVAAFVVGL